jgi:hypothetical protein
MNGWSVLSVHAADEAITLAQSFKTSRFSRI